MNKNLQRPALLALLIVTLFMAPGCGWFSSMSTYSSSPAPTEPTSATPVNSVYERFSPSAPPALRPESMGQIQNPKVEAWRPGYWSYDNGNFSWVPGAVIQKPAFTAVWTAAHWEQRDYGWAFLPGYWQ